MTKELLQQALDALLPHGSSYGNGKRPVEDAAIERLKQALAQQEQPAVRLRKGSEAAPESFCTVTYFDTSPPYATYPAPARPAIKDDIGVACLETMVKTMTNLGLATDASLEGFGARLESNIYAMCRAVDGIFKAQPAMSDERILEIWAKTYVQRGTSGIEFAREVIKAHCNGGLK